MRRWSKESMPARLNASCWILLLIPILFAVWEAGAPTWLNSLRIVGIVIFSVGYVIGCFWLPDEAMISPRFSREVVLFLAVLVILMLANIPLLGAQVFVFTPYLAAVAIWTFPLVIGVPLALVLFIAQITTNHFVEIPLGLLIATGMVVMFNTLSRLARDQGARHEQEARQQAMLAERERVARDVHDVLGHSLTAISVKADLAYKLAQRDPAAAAQQMAEVHDLSRAALAEVRETVAGLRVARLDDELIAAQASLADAGIVAHINGEVRDVDPSHRIAVAWALRELVTNVIRHSGAKSCTITLRSDGLEVADDGVGLTKLIEGNGLRGLRERIGAAGGRVDIGPTSVNVIMGTL